MNKKPLVTIITPMYNSESSIVKTLNSILNQTYKNYEVLVVDDISTDDSPNIVKKFSMDDDRIKYLKLSEKGGASIARNKGIQAAKGKYIAFLDADDTWYPEKLEIQINEMEKNNYAFTYTNYDVIKDGTYSHTISAPQTMDYKQLLKSNRIGCLTVIYNKDIIGDITIPKLDKRNDYALWLKALSSGETAYLVDNVLSTYYESDGSLSRSSSKVNLLKYHYQLFHEVLNYNKVVAFLLTIRNGYYNLINNIGGKK